MVTYFAALPDLIQTESFRILLAAFLGAFFAYLFTRLGALADRLFARRQKHRTGLVLIEKQGNEYQNFIGDNLFVINDYTKIAKRRLAEKAPFLYFNELHELPIDKEVYLKLGNIDMVNELFNLEASVEKINSSVRSLNRFMSLIQDAFINKNIDLGTYFANVEVILFKFAEIAVFLNDLEKENKELIAKSRVLIRSNNSSLYVFLLGRVLKKKITEKERKQFPKELDKLEKEIEETKSNDLTRIAKLLELMKQEKN
jgi:hypothetical protein